MKSKIVIIGGGFGGIRAAKTLRRANVNVLIIDKTNHHLFQPLLYQVATAALSASNIATPIREILRKQSNATVMMDEVLAIDKEQKQLKMVDGKLISYDYLVIATGATTNFFGNEDWKAHAHCLKSLSDADKIRDHILFSLELAEQADSLEESMKYLRFICVGGGPTGVEMAGAIAEIALTSMVKNYKKIKPEDTQVYLIEGGDRILPSYPATLSDKAQKALEKLGVKVMTKTFINQINSQGVYAGAHFIESRNIFWAAGNEATPLLKSLNVPLDRQGRVFVEPDLSIKGFPEIFVIGDAAAAQDAQLGYLPGVAPVAMQQGRFVGKIIAKAIPKEKRKSFKYIDKGSMATIGKAKAVVEIGKLHFSGLFAWLIWSLVHIAFLISFRNRTIVMLQWFFLYITNIHNAFIITNDFKTTEHE